MDSSFGVEREGSLSKAVRSCRTVATAVIDMRQPLALLIEHRLWLSAQSAAGQLSEPVHPLSRPVSLGWIAPEIPASMKSGTCYTSAASTVGVVVAVSACSGVPTMPAVSVAPSLSSMSRNEPVRRLSA